MPTIQESIPTLNTVSITGTLTAGSTSVAAPSSTAGLIPGEYVTGTGIAPGTTIDQVGSVTFTAGVSSDNDTISYFRQRRQLAVGETAHGGRHPRRDDDRGNPYPSGDGIGDLILSNTVTANPDTETVTASFLTLSAAATLTGTESLTMSGFSAINADAVFINAKYVDINEPINVGQPNNWSVSLPAALNSTIQSDQSIYNSSISLTLTKGKDQATVPANEMGSLTVGDGISGAGIPSGTTITAIDSTTNKVTLSSNATETGTQSISVWLFTLPASAISAGDTAIPAQYDAITQQIIVSSVSAASGGFIELNGQIMSTNTLGEINVNSDVGQVTIDNQTSYPIVVNNVSASTSTSSSTLSGVDIIDTNLPAGTRKRCTSTSRAVLSTNTKERPVYRLSSWKRARPWARSRGIRPATPLKPACSGSGSCRRPWSSRHFNPDISPQPDGPPTPSMCQAPPQAIRGIISPRRTVPLRTGRSHQPAGPR